MCGKLPLAVAVSSLLGLQLLTPVSDITRPTGSVIAGAGHLLNETTTFVSQSLYDSKEAIQDSYGGIRVANVAGHTGSWCVDEVPLESADEVVGRFRMNFPTAPIRVQDTMQLLVHDLKAGVVQTKAVIREYKAHQFSSGFAAMVLGRRKDKSFTMCVSFTAVDILLTWQNPLNRAFFSAPTPLEANLQERIHNHVRFFMLKILESDFPDQLKITYANDQTPV